MTTELFSLRSAARPLVDLPFLSGERELTREDLRHYIQPLNRSLDLTPIDDHFERIRNDEDIEAHDPNIDAELAPVVHQTLKLTRNEAADAGLWHYLCINRFPEIVHYRWDHVFDPESPGNMIEKFLKAGTDAYSNALHRLWWGAQLTFKEAGPGKIEDRDYSRTKKMFEFQELANDILDRNFARYVPLTHACVDLLCKDELNSVSKSDEYMHPPSNSDIVYQTTTLLREELTVRRVETMEVQDIAEMVEEIRDRVMRRDAEYL